MAGLLRTCLACGLTDDHPKHVVAIPPDMAEVPWHMDCHLSVTGCTVCAQQIEGAHGLTGDDLRKHITKGK